MGRVTLRVKKQDPLVDRDEYPKCELQFSLPGYGGMGSVLCHGDCGGIEISGGEAELSALAEGERTVVAPCGQHIILEVDKQ